MPRSWFIVLCLCGMILIQGGISSASTPRGIVPPMQTTVVTPSDQAHAALERVLSRGEFQECRGINWKPKSSSAISAWFGRVWRAIARGFENAWKPIKTFFSWLARKLSHLFPQRASTPSYMPALGKSLLYLLYVVLGGTVLFLLGLLVNRLLNAQRQRESHDDLDAVAANPTLRRKQEPSFWERSLLEAEALWRQGNEREALRLLHRACLVLLDARGVLHYEDSRANGEVLRELRRQGRADIQHAFKPIVLSFDRSWYGFLPVTGDEFTTVLDNSRHFRNAVVGGQDA